MSAALPLLPCWLCQCVLEMLPSIAVRRVTMIAPSDSAGCWLLDCLAVDECNWNGPSWPFETSKLITGMASLLLDYPPQSAVTPADFIALLKSYAKQHTAGVAARWPMAPPRYHPHAVRHGRHHQLYPMPSSLCPHSLCPIPLHTVGLPWPPCGAPMSET